MKMSILLAGILCLTLVILSGAAFSELESITIKVSPSTIIVGADVEWVTVHTTVPLARVDCSTLTLNGISVAWTKADAKGNLVAKFHYNEIEGIVVPPRAILTLKGIAKDGVPFSGSDSVLVRKVEPRR